MKKVRALLLILALASPIYAGDIQNGVTSSPSGANEPNTLTIILTLIQTIV